MKFGVRLPVNGPFASKKSIVEIAELVDKSGFDSLWTQGHILWSKAQHESQISVGSVEALANDQNPNLFDSITTLAFLSARTRNVRLGFSVFVAPLIHPIIAAKQIADLDVLSDGRIVFCTAPGGPLISQDFQALNIDFKQRAKIADEYIEAILKLWTTDHCSFNGNFVKFNDISLYPKPIQKPHPPIWIAGGDPNATARVARFGSGWMLTTADPRSMVADLSEYSSSLSRLIQKQRQSINDSQSRVTEFALDIFACIAPTDEDASSIASKTIQVRLKRQAQSAGLKIPSQREIENINLIGSPETLTRKIENFENAGITLLELKIMSWDLEQMRSMIGSFAKDVMPSFS